MVFLGRALARFARRSWYSRAEIPGVTGLEKYKHVIREGWRGVERITVARRNKMRMCLMQRLAKLQVGSRD
jgi:hypothetical protein